MARTKTTGKETEADNSAPASRGRGRPPKNSNGNPSETSSSRKKKRDSAVDRRKAPWIGKKKANGKFVTQADRAAFKLRATAGTFKMHIYRVLKQVHPDIRISANAMQIMNDFMFDIFHQIAREAAGLARISKRSTVGSREIQTAVRLLFSGELANHAVSEGTKAVSKYEGSR